MKVQAMNDFLLLKVKPIEEKKTASGLIIFSVFHQSEEITKKNTIEAEVLSINPKEKFLKVGDKVLINQNMGFDLEIEELGGLVRVIESCHYLVKVFDGKLIPHPKRITVRIKKEDRDNLFSKWVVRHDGTKSQLFVNTEVEDKTDIRGSSLFVNVGEVVSVGNEVEGIEIGDTAILDYSVDNDENFIIDYEENEDKIVCLVADTTFHNKTEIHYADRRHKKDRLIFKKGEVDSPSPLLGTIHENELRAREPYVFIEHRKDSVLEKETNSGIVYSEKQTQFKRQILSISKQSTTKFLIKKGDNVVVNDMDIFDLKTNTGTLLQCVNDGDIIYGEFLK